jgi:K+-sensing histidine kinase KdpD
LQQGGLADYVLADEKQLRQVLMNLLSNAVKFTREGRVSLQVNYRNEVEKLIVSDTGVGIRPEHQEHIFNPFERIREQETQFVSGTGLGLTISRLLTKMMEGDLSVQSEHDEGSVLPCQSCCQWSIHQKRCAADTKNKGYSGPRKQISVVDDSPVSLGMINTAFNQAGYYVRFSP